MVGSRSATRTGHRPVASPAGEPRDAYDHPEDAGPGPGKISEPYDHIPGERPVGGFGRRGGERVEVLAREPERQTHLGWSEANRERYRSAYEPGCSVGRLTRLLADRCDDLLAVDCVDEAVETARAGVQDLPHLHRPRRHDEHVQAAELGLASGVIAANAQRLGKSLWTQTDEGEKVRVCGVWDGAEEARTVSDLIEQGAAGPVARVHLDDCGHAPHLEQPDATLDATLDFLAGLP